MKWVYINGEHINTDLIATFGWIGSGVLAIKFVGSESCAYYDDPDKTQYIKLCHVLGVSPELE